MYHHKNNIEFKKIEREDLPLLKDLKDESWFGTHTVTVLNMYDQTKWFESTRTLVLIAFDKNELKHVGIFKIDNQNGANGTADVGWDTFKSCRGRGFGQKIVEAGVDFCFEVLNLRRLTAEVLENNFASQKCATRAGFLQEGNKKEAIFRCNEYLDSRIYGILRKNWEKLRSGLICNLSYQPKDGTDYDQHIDTTL